MLKNTIISAIIVIGLILVFSAVADAARQEWIWAKGQLHCHTTNNDPTVCGGGNLTPEGAATWYRDHGYRFVVTTDHRRWTDPATVKVDGMLFIGGEEIDCQVPDSMKPGSQLHVHLNGLGIKQQLAPLTGIPNATSAIEKTIDQIHSANGIAQLNHPNWRYFLNYKDILAVDRHYLMEIFNVPAHSETGKVALEAGDHAHLGVEQIWDILLSAGRKVYVTAVDDTHNYTDFGRPDVASPGRGWVVAKVKELTVPAVLQALDQGEFYASTGVEVEDIQVNDRKMTVVVKPVENVKYTIQFIGKYGRTLLDVEGARASYSAPKERGFGYVRAKIIDSNGKVAWIQPFWPGNGR